jgi:hypothetical protein
VPYSVRPINGAWAIIRKADGVVVGHSTTKDKADASVRARMSGENFDHKPSMGRPPALRKRPASDRKR